MFFGVRCFLFLFLNNTCFCRFSSLLLCSLFVSLFLVFVFWEFRFFSSFFGVLKLVLSQFQKMCVCVCVVFSLYVFTYND